MAAPGLKPVGFAADRIDLNGEAHRLTLSPGLQLSIPKQSVDKPKREDKTRSHSWTDQESVVQSQADLRQEKREGWRRFQSGSNPRRENFGAIQIDGTKPQVRAATAPAAQLENAGPWTTIDQWHGRAARFEEWGRNHAQSLGGDPGVDKDPSSPSPRRSGGQSKKRRRFTVV